MKLLVLTLLALMFASTSWAQTFTYLGDGGPGSWAFLDLPQRGDFDGDGREDVVVRGEASFGVGMRVQRQIGPGVFATAAVPNISYHSDVVVSDFDGDGRDDLLVGSEALGLDLQVLFGNPNGSFTMVRPPTALYPWNTTPKPRHSVGILDFDGDGDDDVLVFAVHTHEFLRNDGNRQFTALGLDSWHGFDRLRSPVGVDVDQDGFEDLVFTATVQSSGPGERLVWVRSLGDGTFSAPVVLSGLQLPIVRRLQAADMDGDGDQDIVCFLTQGSFGTPLGQTSFWFEVRQGPAVKFHRTHLPEGQIGFRISDVRDVNLDGLNDVVVYAASGDQIILRRGIGQGLFETAAELPYYRTSGGAVALDIDHDGDLDLMTGGLDRWENVSTLGAEVCPASPNSAGPGAVLTVRGSDVVAVDRTTLVVTGMPPGTFGLFVTSLAVAAPTPVPGSVGTLCLGGAIGRFNRPGEIRAADTGGGLQLVLDTADVPDPVTTSVAITASETRAFQLWYRDVSSSTPTSNFSSAVAVDFR